MDRRISSRPTSIVFLCLARDCASTLPIFFRYIQELRAAGLQCDVLIGENGSKDNTRALIIEASTNGVWMVDTSAMSAGATRLDRMALGREMLLQAARAADLLQNDLVCVADLDNVMVRPPAVDAMRNAMEQLTSDDTLFAVSATSQPVYYDLLALRAAGHDYTPLHTAIEEAKKNPLTYFQFHRDRIYKMQQEVSRQVPLRCVSAFNGLCIYKASDYKLGSYLATNSEPIAEHVVFHASVCRQTDKRMLITPTLVLATPADHRPVNMIRFWLDRVRKTAAWRKFL